MLHTYQQDTTSSTTVMSTTQKTLHYGILNNQFRPLIVLLYIYLNTKKHPIQMKTST